MQTAQNASDDDDNDTTRPHRCEPLLAGWTGGANGLAMYGNSDEGERDRGRGKRTRRGEQQMKGGGQQMTGVTGTGNVNDEKGALGDPGVSPIPTTTRPNSHPAPR
jgi:hypothetical protein